MSENGQNDLYLSGIVDRLEEDKAIIIFDNHQEISWPIINLPEGLSEGDNVWITLSTEKRVREDQEKLAKNILKQILKPDAG